MDCSRFPPSGHPVSLPPGRRDSVCAVHCVVCGFVCSAHIYTYRGGSGMVNGFLHSCVCECVCMHVCVCRGYQLSGLVYRTRRVLVKHSDIMTDTHLCSFVLSRRELA